MKIEAIFTSVYGVKQWHLQLQYRLSCTSHVVLNALGILSVKFSVHSSGSTISCNYCNYSACLSMSAQLSAEKAKATSDDASAVQRRNGNDMSCTDMQKAFRTL